MKTIFNIYWSVCLVMLRVSFVSTVSCPHLWDSVRRTYTYLQICIRRLPEAVTWFEGEQQCRNWMGNPLAWNETLDDINNEQNFDIQEPEIWSSLILTNGKLFHSGAPMTTVGMFPFAPPEGPLVITWMSGQPVLGFGDCVMTTKNKTAKFSPCNDKKFMYCQRYPVDPFVKYEPSFCLDGYVGNVEWSKCYKLINDAATFAEASLKCQNEGASLTSIDDIIKTGVEVGAGTANEEMLKAAAIFFFNIINSNTSYPVNSNVLTYFTDHGIEFKDHIKD